jgi:hypothetical protein
MNVKREKEREKFDLQRPKVMKVKFLNLDLGLLSKYLGVKFGETIKQYEALLFTKFQRKNMCFVRIMRF